MELTMFDMMQQLVGLEKLLVDMAQGSTSALMDKCGDFALAVGKQLIRWGWMAFGPATISARKTAC
jgi:hypothetical protein